VSVRKVEGTLMSVPGLIAVEPVQTDGERSEREELETDRGEE
jgi:hypothetical protein